MVVSVHAGQGKKPVLSSMRFRWEKAGIDQALVNFLRKKYSVVIIRACNNTVVRGKERGFQLIEPQLVQQNSRKCAKMSSERAMT